MHFAHWKISFHYCLISIEMCKISIDDDTRINVYVADSV